MPNRDLLTNNTSQTGNPPDHTVFDDVFGKNDKYLWYIENKSPLYRWHFAGCMIIKWLEKVEAYTPE